MQRHLYWQPWAEPGLEHLHLRQTDNGFLADGVILGYIDAAPLRLHYTVLCDAQWRVRSATVRRLDNTEPPLQIRHDGQGNWTTATAVPLPDLAGCIDVDLSATPFTNTLPIRRLALQPGAQAEIDVVYIAAPSLTIEPMRQRYTCLAASPTGGVYRFESVQSGFTADLPVDAAGLVLDYPELFRRVWPLH